MSTKQNNPRLESSKSERSEDSGSFMEGIVTLQATIKTESLKGRKKKRETESVRECA